MRKKICFKVNKLYLQNRLFEEKGDLNFFFKLKNLLDSKGYHVGTQDMVDEKKSNFVIYLDYRKDFKKSNAINVLIALESIAALPQTFNKTYLKKFDYIFTWNKEIIDNKRIFNLNYSYDLNLLEFVDFSKKNKLICNFSANKLSNHNDELYSERVKAIEFFNKNYPNHFDLYGYGWDKSFKFPKVYNFFKFLNQTKFLRGISKLIFYSNLFNKVLYKNYDVYKGSVDSKIDILKHYKFSICYENVKNIEGYITEKIFDCFKCGVIPIYLGSSSIHEHIPKDTFIDMRNYKSYSDLYNHIVNMKESEYNSYIKKIMIYFNSDKIKQFKSSNCSNEFVQKLLEIETKQN